MKYKWLNKQNNDKLIVFFNGWGMDEGVVKHLEPGDYDVVMFYDYNNLDTDFFLDKEYSETNIIAWSMGVMIAGILLSCHCEESYLYDDAAIHTCKNKLDCFGLRPRNDINVVAINGTFKPIDPKYGIHPKIYDLTIKGFDENSRDKFIENMFDGTPISSCGIGKSCGVTFTPLAPCGRGQGEGLKTASHFYTKKSLEYSKILRKNMTDAENILWYYLRNKQLNNMKFRRQEAIDKYIADFVCYEKKLIIELDGGEHVQSEKIIHDKERDTFLSQRGFKVLRIYNTEIYKNISGVIEHILSNSENPSPDTPVFDCSCHPLPQGERGIHLHLTRTLENQKSELIALKNYKANIDFKPDKIIISDNDKIIPTESQCAFWGMEPNFQGGHCPFFSFKKWSELL